MVTKRQKQSLKTRMKNAAGAIRSRDKRYGRRKKPPKQKRKNPRAVADYFDEVHREIGGYPYGNRIGPGCR